jgi:CRISPR/Cas system-associated exonuclease Cas4 (RecB family)
VNKNNSFQNNIRLSPSALSLYLECPKCFWLQKINGIHRPSQVFALQSNFDRILKPYFDKFRKEKKLPPELMGKVEGMLFDDQELLEKWRNALKPTLKYCHPQYENFSLAGGLDDCLVVSASNHLFDGRYYIPLDFKTTGSSSFEENSEKYYQHQLDIYNFLLEENGYKTKGIAYLIYYKPEEVVDEGLMKFQIVVKKMETDHKRALRLFEDAIELLQNPMPKSHSECEYCSWANDFID